MELTPQEEKELTARLTPLHRERPTVEDVAELSEKLRNIGPGEEVVYHTGNLVRDRGNKGSPLSNLANLAYRLCCDEDHPQKLHLFQRKTEEFATYQYIAVGVRP